MSDKSDDQKSRNSDLACDAMVFSTPIIYGSVFGPPGVVGGAVLAAIALAIVKSGEGSAANASQSNKTG